MSTVCGITVDEQLARNATLNSSFSQRAWEAAKQEGCLACPNRPRPKWPPNYIYPTSDGRHVEDPVVGADACVGTDNDSTQGAAYFQRPQSILPFPPPAPFQGAPTLYNAPAVQPVSAYPGQYQEANNPERLLTDADVLRLAAQNPATAAAAQAYIDSHVGDDAGLAAQGKTHTPSGAISTCSPITLNQLIPCTWNTLRGVWYDLSHWSELPVPTDKKWEYVFARDDRPFYLAVAVMALVVVLLVLLLLVRLLFGGGRTSSYRGIPYCIPVAPPPRG